MATQQTQLVFQGDHLGVVQRSSDDASDSVDPSAKKRRTEHNIKWEEGRDWLYFDDTKDGMFCKLCQSWNKKPHSGKAVWSTVPCTCMRSGSVVRHENSQQHIDAVKLQKQTVQSESDGGIVASFDQVWEAEIASLKSALMCLYWLCKEEVPHTTKFSHLLDLVSLLDSEVLSHLNKGGNTTYRSQRSIAEFLSLIGSNIRNSIKAELENTPFLGIMIDETTDLSTTKQLIFYSKYLVRPLSEDQTPLEGVSVWTRFLGIIELSHADAESITKALLNFMETCYDLDMHKLKKKLAGFGSDGASVMTGRHSGVGVRLQDSVPSLVSVHCIAHKLALAASGAASHVSCKLLPRTTEWYVSLSSSVSCSFISICRSSNSI